MSVARVHDLSIGYRVFGESGQPWVITPGGRFSKDTPGLPELASALAAKGNRVLIWDRPNCGESDVCFDHPSECEMHADVLAGLLRELQMSPAVIIGGADGSRSSLIAAANHPEVTGALALMWISGGPFSLMTHALYYCGNSFRAAWTEGMEAVVALPEWEEVIKRNSGNRQRILDQDPGKFAATMERWMLEFCPAANQQMPGLEADLAQISAPTLIFRNGLRDPNHTVGTTTILAESIRNAVLVEPPWPDSEFVDGMTRYVGGEQASPFIKWPLLVPQLQEWANDVLA